MKEFKGTKEKFEISDLIHDDLGKPHNVFITANNYELFIPVRINRDSKELDLANAKLLSASDLLLKAVISSREDLINCGYTEKSYSIKLIDEALKKADLL